MLKFEIRASDYTCKMTAGFPEGVTKRAVSQDALFSNSGYNIFPAGSGTIAGRPIRFGGLTRIWNQLWNHGGTTTTALNTDGGSATINGVTWTRSGLKYVASGTASKRSEVSVPLVVPVGHTIFISGSPAIGDSNFDIRIWFANGTSLHAITDTLHTISESDGPTATARLQVQGGYTADDLEFTPQIFDFTQMFGAGNEPTIAQFKSWKSSSYEYDGGSVLNSKISTVYRYKTENETVYSIPSEILSTDGYGVGLDADVYNYLDINSETLVKNVGAIDLGSCPTWKYSTYYKFFYTYCDAIKDGTTKFLTTNGYAASDINTAKSGTVDKIIASYGSAKNIVICDYDYTDIDAFKAAVSGVTIFYERSYPQVVDVSSYFTDDMRSLKDPYNRFRVRDLNAINPISIVEFIGRY